MLKLTQETRDELLRILTYRLRWREDLKYYGGHNGLAHDRDWRVRKGELAEVFPALIEKLQELDFESGTKQKNETEIKLKLSDTEIVCLGWFLKKHLRNDRRSFGLSAGLCSAFHNIPQSARVKGHRVFLPYDGQLYTKLKSALSHGKAV